MRRVPWHFINCVTPPAFGQMIGRGFRKKSIARQAADSKPRTYYDIKDEAVIPFIEKVGCDTLVCGHIHQPQERHYTLGGKARRLLVLSDWKPDGAIIARSVEGGPLELMRLAHDGLAPWEHEVKAQKVNREPAPRN